MEDWVKLELIGEKTTENAASSSRESIANYLSPNLASLKGRLLFVNKSIEEATATSEVIKVLTRELEQKNMEIALLQEELRRLKHAQQRSQEDAANLRALTREQSAKIAETLDRMVQSQMAEQRWKVLSEQYKEAVDNQRSETMELRTRHETLLRNEASLQAKYEMLESQLKELKSNSVIRKADSYAQPNANKCWYQIGNVCCKCMACPSSAVTRVEKEAAWTGKNFPSLEIVANNSFDKSLLSSAGREQIGSAAIEHVNIRPKETLKRPADFRSSEFGVRGGEQQPYSKELENAEKQTHSKATAILKIAAVEMALPPLMTPISHQPGRKEKLPSEQARKSSSSEPKRNVVVRAHRRSDEDTTASFIQAGSSNEKEKEERNTALKLCSIPQKLDKTKNCNVESSVHKSCAARNAVELIPFESLGKRGKWHKDRALHDRQPPSVRKLVNADDGTHLLGSSVHVSATKSLVTAPAVGAADLDANPISNLEEKRPLSKDVEVIRSKNIIEHTDALCAAMEERVAIHCDDTLPEISQERKNNDLTFDWVIKFAGSFQLAKQCRVSLPPLSMPVSRGFTMERYLVGLFDKNTFLTPALACRRLHSLGESLTPQTLTNSIITVLLSRGFRTANLCRMAVVVQLEPIKVKGERCIVELLERLFDVRPSAWRSEVKKLLIRQLLLRLRHLRGSLTAAQMETLCRFYVLFAESIKSTAAVRRLIEAAAVLVIEEKAELAMSVLISWPKAFKEIACDIKRAFARVVLTLLVSSTKAVPLNVMERLIFEFCGENIRVSTLEYERLFANLSDCLLSRGMVELSTVTGDVRLAKTWARKLLMLEILFKLSSDHSVVSTVRDKFYMDVTTWPSKSSQLTISGNRFRSVLVSLIALSELADVTTAFCQLELCQLVRKLEEILKGEGMYAENTILRSCCCQLLVRLLPWYPKLCYRILEGECSAAIAGAQWARLFKTAKRVYIDGIMPK